MDDACPLPPDRYAQITLAHGGGGKLSQRLLHEVFYPAFDPEGTGERHDGATLRVDGVRIAFSTDSHVVQPLFFPGGDIGALAVIGTANDLAMCGAEARWLSLGFILEEGLPLETLRKVVSSAAATARALGIAVVAGDTKVVERGRCDGLYLTSAGIGVVRCETPIAASQVREDDVLLLSGDLGRHGIAVLARREGFDLESPLESDCAPLWPAVAELLERGIRPRFLRDLTRGGLAAALAELAGDAHHDLRVDEASLAASPPVRGACEILGLDPIHIPNEGRMVVCVAPEEADRALAALRAVAISRDAVRIGRVGARGGRVWLRGALGQDRLLMLPSGEQLPRIC